METIIVAIITGGLSLLGVVITNMQANKKIEIQLDKQQAITDTKLEELTREVRTHNDFAKRIPVLENKIENLEKKVG